MINKVFQVKDVQYVARLLGDQGPVAIHLPAIVQAEQKVDASLVPEENTPVKQFQTGDIDSAIEQFKEWKLKQGVPDER